MAQKTRRRMDTVQAGGRYIVAGRYVDAEGNPLKGTKAAEDEAAAEAARKADQMPDDFPGRDFLVSGGYPTLSAVSSASDEDLDAVPGIGPATLKEIRAALK